MNGEQFTAGQRVIVEIAGGRVECVFVRRVAQPKGIDERTDDASGGLAGDIAWVRRSDTGEVEPFELCLISTVD